MAWTRVKRTFDNTRATRGYIDGLLLSDACVLSHGKGRTPVLQQTFAERYLEWAEMIKERLFIFGISTSISETYHNGGYCQRLLKSKAYKEFWEYRSRWYNGRRKTLPEILDFTKETYLNWYLGDGCLVKRKNEAERHGWNLSPYIKISTNNFKEKEILRLSRILKEELDIDASIMKCGKGKGLTLNLRAKGTPKFLEHFKSCKIPKCFQYKVALL